MRVAPDFFQRWIVREESFAGAEELYKMAEKSTSSLIEFYKKELKKAIERGEEVSCRA